MQEFTYHAPRSLPEAVAILSAHPGSARCLAGGTDLVLAMDRGRLRPSHVVDLKHIPELQGIAGTAPGGFTIGALTPMEHLESHGALIHAYPVLTDAAAFVGGPAIRNRATLGGNLCNASPAADTATPLLVCGADLDVVGSGGKRSLPISEFWLGPGQSALSPGEVLVAIRLPPRSPRSGNAFQRVTRTAMDIAIVNAAVDLTLDESGNVQRIAVAIGAAGPTPILVPGVDSELRGRPLDKNALEILTRRVQEVAQPRDDVRGSAAYRKDQCGVLTRRAVRAAMQRAAGKEGQP